MRVHVVNLLSIFAIGQSVSAYNAIGGNNISTGNPSQCQQPTQFFTQLVNQTESSTSTFNQQYQIITDYFKEGGPILFLQNGNNLAYQCLETTSLVDWAQELGALLVGLEHRYLGLSTPYGLNFSDNQNWATESLNALTLANSLLDSVTVVNWVKSTVPGAGESKVIAAGSDYAATIAGLLRIHYPDVFDGAIASGGVFTFETDPDGPIAYSWGNWINAVFQDYSPEVSQKLATAFSELTDHFQTKNYTGLQSELTLCYPLNSTDDEWMLRTHLLRALNGIVQFDQASPLENAPSFPFNTFLNQSLASNVTGLGVLKIASGIDNQQTGSPCADWNPAVRGYLSSLPFTYITCTFYPYLY